MLSLFIAFASGALFTAILAVILGRRVVVSVNVPDVAVALPESLQVVLEQPAAPKDRGTLWREIYDMTLDARGYPSYNDDIAAATLAANRAVEVAFP